jgi:hypothetical protein
MKTSSPRVYCDSSTAELSTPAAITAKKRLGKKERAQMAALGRDGAMTTSFLLSFTVLTISRTAAPGVTPSGVGPYRTVGS